MKVNLILNGKTYGGTEQHTLNLAMGLRAMDVSCCVITEQHELINKLNEVGIPVETVPFGNFLKACKKIRRICVRDCNIVHAQRVDSFAYAYAAMQGLNIPVLCTLHSLFSPEILKATKEEIGINTGNILTTDLLQKADRLIAISRAVKESLVINNIDEKSIQIIFNGIGDTKPARIYDNRKETFTIGFVGRLDFEKGPDIILESARILAKKIPYQFKICFVGDGPLRNKLDQLVKNYNLDDYCIFKGFESNPLEVMSEFDVLVLPSREEGMGLVILEAMSLNVPVIATNVGGINEAVHDKYTGLLIEKENPEALANAIELLMKSPKMKLEMAENAFRVRKDKFSLQVFAGNHIKLYNSLLGI